MFLQTFITIIKRKVTMVHYILMKMKPDYSLDEMEKLFHQCYPKIADELTEVQTVGFFKNINPENDMDVMIQVEVSSQEGLAKYKNHPLHKFFIRETSDFVISFVRFDCVCSNF